MKQGKRTKRKNKTIERYGVLLFLGVLLISIAYAQIAGQQMNVEADIAADSQEGVFIADVVSQDTANGKINYYQDTLLSSKVTLPNSSSTVTYEVTLYNNSNEDYVYIGELIDENAYKGANGEKNESIGYTINGLTKGVTTIAPKASLPFTITFAFKDGADTTNNVLESIINFRFKELPIIDLSNEGETYTIENAFPGMETAEYEFIVQNYTEEDTNHVPMKYHFETTIDSPLQAKIYDSEGNEVTESIDLKGDGQAEEKTYTLKIMWDANDTEFDIEEALCNVKLIAKPTNEKYEDYEIVKEFNVEIRICNHTYENGICTKCGAECVHTYENAICTKCGCRMTVEAGEKATATAEYTDGTNTAIIPAGFTVSGVESEQTIEEGLVLYLIDDMTESEIEAIDWTNATTVANLQQTYDQFVWIPVDDINDMYMCQSEDGTKSCNIKVANGEAYCTTHSSNQMAGRLYAKASYAGETYDASLTNQTYNPESALGEPGTSSKDAQYLDQLNEILSTNYASASDFMNDLQSEYNKIVKSIYQNQGFYIGRYETSEMTNSNTNVRIKVVSATTSGITSVNWYRMYAQQKIYAINIGLTSSIGSTMIQGAAYDKVMKFVDNSSDRYGGTFDVTAGKLARHSGSLSATGRNGHDKVKNIYDIEGNVYTRTTEVRLGSERVTRGYYYYKDPYQSASYRSGVSPTSSNGVHGSICQLYLNCSHTFEGGTCTKCGYECKHDFENNICTNCGYECVEHKYTEGVCTVCGKVCEHNYIDNVCTICGKERKSIPISTVDQLLKIGSNEEVTIDGKTYIFSSNGNYELQNDISFSIADYVDQYPNSFGTETYTGTETTTETYTNEVTNYETANTTDSPYSTYTAKGTGTYKLEVWGAQGGTYNSSYATGGKGGYSVGTITLNEGDKLYVYVGGPGGYGTSGASSSVTGGGYNGGGAAGLNGGTGGGATDIRFTSGTWNNSASLLSRVIVAGGGGGAYSYDGYGANRWLWRRNIRRSWFA